MAPATMAPPDTATETVPAPAPAPAPRAAVATPVVHMPGGRAVIPPAIVAERMQRYSIWLMLLTGGLIALNATNLELGMVLWFAAGVTAMFALLCAVTVVILNAIAWNFARLAEELRGGRAAQNMQ